MTAQSAALLQRESWEMRGSLGPYAIGLHYTLSHGDELASAHYFYASKLQNIPLTASVQEEAIELKGADGGTFHLRFIGNGSNGDQPLPWGNSIGLSGTWTFNTRTLPVRLTNTYSTSNPGQRFYEQVTQQDNEAFEAMVQATRKATLEKSPDAAAKGIHFPLRVNFDRTHMLIRNTAELKTAWPRIFPSSFLAEIRATIPHEMFVHNGEAMLGDGALWFSEQGLNSVNVQ